MSTLKDRGKELHQAYQLGLKCYSQSGDAFEGCPYPDDHEAMKAFSRGLQEGRQREQDYWNRNW